MLDFYLVPFYFRVALQCFAIAGFGVQAVLCIIHLYRPGWSERYTAEWLLELATLMFTGLMGYLLAVVEQNARSNSVVFSGMHLSFYLLFIILMGLGGAVFYKYKSPGNFLPALAAFMILPLWERQGYFVLLYLGAIGLLVARSVLCIRHQRRKLRNKLSALSIKDAVDSLPSGILFCEEDGNTVLFNLAMQDLMEQLMGGQVRNGLTFYEALKNGEVLRGEQKYALATSVVYEFPDCSVWRFKCDEIFIGNKIYYQISAANITMEWQLTNELENKRGRLDKQKEILMRMLEDMEQLSYQKELLKRKSRVHDVLGERIAVVQNLLRSEAPDITAVAARIKSMENELRQDNEAVSVTFEQMAQSFKSVGVELMLHGRLPDGETGLFILDLIRECSTNAVRHGFASRVEVNFKKERGGYLLTISNNGDLPEVIRESGGLFDMRQRIEDNGGSLEIVTKPVFTMTAWIKEE